MSQTLVITAISRSCSIGFARLSGLHGAVAAPDSDARSILLRGLEEVVGGYGMVLRAMCYDRNEQQRNEQQVDEAPGTATDDTGAPIGPVEKRRIAEHALRLGLVTLFMFKADALFSRLLTALGQRPAMGFYRNSDAILRPLNLPANPNAQWISRPSRCYFYDPYKKAYRGYCPASYSGEYKRPAYSLLPDEHQKATLSKIPESAFPPLGKLPAIPESKDGARLDPPR